ncbi:hypothetical protein POVWA2_023490 [Plasmodium ovale wallikeri]|uniref:Uncharacterized protein n=1 Tax=Plasmodium ovale wallikeri TaxID=864142 RepID=A0A1A8YTF5_PLAOA|nr:hypothetical protein POVWA1_023690 [Plasmodium ovale wallikeri]SBT35139.1 hypothetical protein POVWA2_023490 [Plasmodium ovale wallikeri]
MHSCCASLHPTSTTATATATATTAATTAAAPTAAATVLLLVAKWKSSFFMHNREFPYIKVSIRQKTKGMVGARKKVITITQ